MATNKPKWNDANLGFEEKLWQAADEITIDDLDSFWNSIMIQVI